MEDDNTFYKKIAKKSDLDIMFIIENPDDYDKEYYYAAVKIGLQRRIILKSDFDEAFLKEFNENINEIVAKENAKPKKPFNFFLNGLYFIVLGLVFFILSLAMNDRYPKFYIEIKVLAFITIPIGLVLIIIGIIKIIKNTLSKQNNNK